MDVILVCPNFQKDNLVPFSDFQADFFESGINLLAKHDTPVFGWTHQMVDQHGDIVALMDIFAHESYGNIPEQSEASFGESDPQRLKIRSSGNLKLGLCGVSQLNCDMEAKQTAGRQSGLEEQT
jgi:hypothetical protein